MAAKDTRISPVRSKTTVKATQESQEPVRLPSRWHVICRPKIFVPVVWIVATVLLLAAIFLYFITKRWPILEEDEPTQRKRNPQVVVILIPGMRWDALDTWTERELRGFRPFFSQGVRVSQVEPVFPSFSLPSWTTLQTGLYPEEHAILGNAMYDSEEQMDFDEFRDSVKDDRWWQEREPIWITATEAGRRVATLQWNNADVPFYGKLPEVAQGYTASSSSFLERVENVTKLLRQEFNLIMVSYDGLENATKKYGPFSKQAREQLRDVAVGLHFLFAYLFRTGRQLDAQLLVVSDRGYETVCPPRAQPPPPIYLNALLVRPAHVVRAVPDRRLLLVYAFPSSAPALRRRLAALEGYRAFLREDIPDEFHYKRGKWAPDILMYPLTWNRTLCPHRSSTVEQPETEYSNQKMWDFQPTAPALLLGWGSDFKSKRTVYPPIRLVDVYQVMTHLLGVKARPHNGSWSRVSRFLVAR